MTMVTIPKQTDIKNVHGHVSSNKGTMHNQGNMRLTSKTKCNWRRAHETDLIHVHRHGSRNHTRCHKAILSDCHVICGGHWTTYPFFFRSDENLSSPIHSQTKADILLFTAYPWHRQRECPTGNITSPGSSTKTLWDKKNQSQHPGPPKKSGSVGYIPSKGYVDLVVSPCTCCFSLFDLLFWFHSTSRSICIRIGVSSDPNLPTVFWVRKSSQLAHVSARLQQLLMVMSKDLLFHS